MTEYVEQDECERCLELAWELDYEKRNSQMLRKAILYLLSRSLDSNLFEDGEEVISLEDIT